MRVSLTLACILALSPMIAGTAAVQAQPHKGAGTSKGAPFSHHVEAEKVNQNLLMLLGGALGGPWIQMAQDVATTVDSGDSLRVLPAAGGGAKSNLRDVLLLRGVDLAITRLDVLNDA